MVSNGGTYEMIEISELVLIWKKVNSELQGVHFIISGHLSRYVPSDSGFLCDNGVSFSSFV